MSSWAVRVHAPVVTPTTATWLSVSAAEWVTVLNVNVTGTFFMTQSVLPSMREQGSDTDVNISPLPGHRAMALTGPAYSAAKARVNSFTESLNLAEGRHGIRARAMGPGEVATPILDKRLKRPSAAARASTLQPEDLAQTLLFLATLPQRATAEKLTIFAKQQPDGSDEVG